MLKLVIGNKNYSSWSLRAWMFLSYHKIAFEEVRISLGLPATKSEILKYSAAGKVPILIDDELVIWDSLLYWNICLNGFSAAEDGRKMSRNVLKQGRSVQKCIHLFSHFERKCQ